MRRGALLGPRGCGLAIDEVMKTVFVFVGVCAEFPQLDFGRDACIVFPPRLGRANTAFFFKKNTGHRHYTRIMHRISW